MKRSNAFLVGLGFFLLFSISGICIVIDWVRFLVAPLVPFNKGFNYILPAGGSIRVLSNDLVQLGILNRPHYFELAAYLKNYAAHLQAGEYYFAGGTTPIALLKQIVDGRVLWRKITFVEGMTFTQVLTEIISHPLIVQDLAGYPSMVIMMKLNLWKKILIRKDYFFQRLINIRRV